MTASVLNVRAQPTTHSSVVTAVKHGDRVDVNSISGNWASVTYQGQSGYASVKFLEKVPEIQVDEKSNTMEALADTVLFSSFMSLKEKIGDQSVIWLYISMGFLVIFACIRFFCDIDVYFEEETVYSIGVIGYILMSVSELIYFIGFDGNPIWFCAPSSVGWLWTIINFIIFLFGVIIQTHTFLFLIFAEHFHGERRCDDRVGMIGMVIFIAILLLCGFFWKSYFQFMSVIFIIGLVCWLGWMVYTNVRDGGSWINLIGVILMWTVGMFATLLVIAHFIVLLIVALIILAAIAILSSSSGSRSRSSSTSSDFSSSDYSGSSWEDEEERHYIVDQYGNEKEVDLDMFGTTAREKGSFSGPTYRKTSQGWIEE